MDDVISRNAAIDAALSVFSRGLLASPDIRKLPSVQPERKTGRWLKSYADHEVFGIRPFFRYCSECNEATVHAYNFCPNCGSYNGGENDQSK